MGEKCAIYIRVSSDIQDYERQITDLKGFAKTNNFDLKDDCVYEDKLSGFKDESEREGLALLLKDVVAKNIKVVLVWEMSRLARKHRLLLEITEFFQDNSINVYFFTQRFWLLDESNKISPQAGLSIAFFGWHGEYEARLTKERFISAKKQNVALGRYNGGHITFGYTLDDENRFIINDEKVDKLDVSESDIVKEVFNYYEQGLTCSHICRICRSKSYPKIVCNTHTLSRLLRNTAYIGYKNVKLGKRPTPAIIEKSQFEIVRNLIDANKTKADKGRKHTYLLRGVLKCSVCGEYYVGKQTDDAYICPKNSGSNQTNKGSSCKGNNISTSILDGILWERTKSICVYIQNSELDDFFITNKNKIRAIEQKLKEFKDLRNTIDSKRKRTNLIFQNDGYTPDEYKVEIERIKLDKENCNAAIKDLEVELRHNENLLTESNQFVQKTEKLNQIQDRKHIKKLIKMIVSEIIFYKINMFKTVVLITYHDGSKEYVVYNAVAKKGNLFKRLNYSFFSFDPNEKVFYSVELENDFPFQAKASFLKENNIGDDLPSTIPVKMFLGICQESNLTDFEKYDILTPNPREDMTIQYSFEEIMNLTDKDSIVTTHRFEKITYFKELNKDRFRRKK